MKQVSLGVYCVAHLDLPIMVSNDLDITKLNKNQLNDLILNGKIKFANDSHQELMLDYDSGDSAIDILETSICCGSFRLSKIEYLLHNDITTKIK